MAFQSTTGLGVAAKIAVEGNVSSSTVPGKNHILLSLSGVNGPATFQLNPQLQDAAGNEVTAGTVFTLTSVASSTPGPLTLTAVAASVNGDAIYTGTITSGGSNAYQGQSFVVAGFTNASNNGLFVCAASTTTTLTLVNALALAETHAATATPEEGTAVYTGTVTGGGSNAFAGLTFVVAGFVTHTSNNGTFIATASSATTLTLENAAAVSETHAATASTQEVEGGNLLTYVSYGFKTLTGNTYQPSGTATAVATVSATGLVTAVAQGETTVETSYPTFNNTIGDVVSSGNIMNGLPINKVYAEQRIHVVI